MIRGEGWPTEGLVALYRFSDLLDSSGNGHTLTAQASPTFVAGKFGNCISGLNGSSQYLKADTLGQSLQSPHAISMWVNPTSAPSGSTPVPLVYWGESRRAMSLDYYYNRGGWLSFSPTGNTSPINVAHNLGVNSWHKIDISSDGTNEFVYVDGVLVIAGTAGGFHYSASMLRLGGSGTGNGGVYSFDEMEFFSRERPPTEIRRELSWLKRGYCSRKVS